VISDYLDALTDALRFDPALARRVREEVEDHFCEAVATDPAGDPHAAARRAIAAFGDPHVIAAELALVSLARESRRAGAALVAVIAGVFLAMKARVAWYAALNCALGDDVRDLGAWVGTVDRYAFWLAVVIGIGGFATMGSRQASWQVWPAYRGRLRRFFLLCAAATGALGVSIVSDGVLTALRLPGAESAAQVLVPVASMAIEIACAAVLAFQLCRMTQRAAATAALLGTVR